MLKKLSLIQKFVLLSLAAIIPTGLAVGFILSRQIEIRALAQARAETSLLAETVISPLLTRSDLSGLTEDRYAELDGLIRDKVLPHSVAQVKVWNPRGTVIYSNFRELVGRSYGVSEDLEEALDGETVSEISSLQKAEHAELRQLGEALEVYVPLRLDGEIVGAFEIYRPYQPIAAGIRTDQRRLYAVIALGLLVLFVLLGRIVRRASRALVNQAEELSELYARERETVVLLREVDELKTDIVAAVSHELKTPITVMRGGLETILTRGWAIEAEQREELLEMALRNTKRIETLVGDLLEVPKIYSGERKVSPEPVGLEGLLAELAAGHDGRVRTDLPPTGRTLSTDREMLRRILALLVDNAVKFSSSGSPVILRVRDSGDEIHISVEDEGPGVPPGEEERIFEPFYQVDHGPSRTAGGVGLGLHLARKLATLLGGRLRLEQDREKGAAFVLSLPAHSDHQLAAS